MFNFLKRRAKDEKKTTKLSEATVLVKRAIAIADENLEQKGKTRDAAKRVMTLVETHR